MEKPHALNEPNTLAFDTSILLTKSNQGRSSLSIVLPRRWGGTTLQNLLQEASSRNSESFNDSDTPLYGVAYDKARVDHKALELAITQKVDQPT